jgi:hypothetical protein
MPSSIMMRITQGKLATATCEIFADAADLDLTQPGTSLSFYIKTSQTTPDSDGATITLGTGTGEITVLGAVATVTIAAAHVPVAGTFWYHLDVTQGGAPRTAAAGPFIVEAV